MPTPPTSATLTGDAGYRDDDRDRNRNELRAALLDLLGLAALWESGALRRGLAETREAAETTATALAAVPGRGPFPARLVRGDDAGLLGAELLRRFEKNLAAASRSPKESGKNKRRSAGDLLAKARRSARKER